MSNLMYKSQFIALAAAGSLFCYFAFLPPGESRRHAVAADGEGLVDRVARLEKHLAAVDEAQKRVRHVLVYLDVRATTPPRTVGCTVKKVSADTFQINFNKPFADNEYTALLSSLSNRATLSGNASGSIVVTGVAATDHFWLAVIDDRDP